MTAKKAPPAAKTAGPAKTTQAARAILRHPRACAGAALFVALFAGAALLWRHVRETVLAGPDYRVAMEQFVVTPPPVWIVTPVRDEAIRNASLDGGPSVLDEDLVQRVAQAFSAHPWVERVERVEKRHPARVEIALVYRRPVCMVELPGGAGPEGGLYPVDAGGMVLPTADFSPLEAQKYPRLVGITSLPLGAAGTSWGDARVAGGAAIAAALLDCWTELKLARIEPASPSPGEEDIAYDLYTEAGTRIVWGRAPNGPTPGEAPAEAKVAKLRKFAADRAGGLDGADGVLRTIDVRPWNDIPQPPERTAARDEER